MNHNGKISIIVPVYRVEKYLNRCVDSILAQSYQNIELVLVEDGSPDRCKEICNQYSLLDTRVKVVHQDNMGVSIARNTGLDVASGDYIGFVDSDDYIEPDMYEVLFSLIEKTQSDIACISMINYDESGNCLPIVEEEETFIYTSEQAIQNMFFDNRSTCGHLWNKLYKAALFKGLRLDHEIKVREDALILWELYRRSKRIAFQRKCKYHYLYYPTSAAHGFSAAFLTGRRACQILLKRTDRVFPQIKKYAQYYLIEADLQIIAKMVESGCWNKNIYKQVKREIKTNMTKEVKEIYKTQLKKKRMSIFIMLHNIQLYRIIKKIL